jgi:hypothetical protein
VALCGRVASFDGDDTRVTDHAVTVHEVVLIPYDECPVRRPDRVIWSTERFAALLERASRRGLALLKIHSHPTGYPTFSETDDASDRELFGAVQIYLEDDRPHVSAVMLPDGRMFARVVDARGDFTPVRAVTVAGADFHVWPSAGFDVATSNGSGALTAWQTDGTGRPVAVNGGVAGARPFTLRTAQAFGTGTVERLRHLSVGIIGVSGTGSPSVEMLARLGVSELVLVDDGRMEDRNQNRILHSTSDDVRDQRYKVDVLADAVERMGLGTRVVRIRESLWSADVVRRVARCDGVFGCMDSIDGRQLLNRLATYYLMPYIDVGVRLDADGVGGVDNISGSVHYLFPGGSSLVSRGAITLKDIQEAVLRRTEPEAHRAQVKAGYINGANEERPAVISVNMLYASLGVNELLARLHRFRADHNREFGRVRVLLHEGRMINEPEGDSCPALLPYMGRGDTAPLLGTPALSVRTNGGAR